MPVQNVVLVRGAFVDASGTRGVYDRLTADGFDVRAVQNPTAALEADVAATHRVLDQLDGPAILVGHSYGGMVITEAGRHERVAGLVYVAEPAFMADSQTPWGLEALAGTVGEPANLIATAAREAG